MPVVLENTAPVMPDFSTFKNVKQKKQRFFDFMVPMVQQINADIEHDRNRLFTLSQINKRDFSTEDISWLLEQCALYKKTCPDRGYSDYAKELFEQIGSVPVSLAVSQAANESAWGTSRFAKQAYNFFGEWCYSEGCGIVPLRRDKGLKHEIRKFEKPIDSIRSYIHNVNTGWAYEAIRLKRQKLRAQRRRVTGLDLSFGLEKYSARGEEYVKEINAMIKVNKLTDYDY